MRLVLSSTDPGRRWRAGAGLAGAFRARRRGAGPGPLRQLPKDRRGLPEIVIGLPRDLDPVLVDRLRGRPAAWATRSTCAWRIADRW